MMYDTNNPLEVENLRFKVEKLISKGSMVEIVEKRPRSLKANAYLHTILAYFALQTGNSLDEVKTEYYKKAVNGDIFIRTKQDNLLGKKREVLRSTASLTAEEMSLSIERFRNWSAQVAEIYIPSSEEYIALLHIQHDITNDNKYI